MANMMLVIEDEPLLGSELQRYYQRNGWETMWVQDIASAEKLLLEDALEPLAVICDMNLPDGNGLDLLERVAQKIAKSEWVFLTGYGGVSDSVRALRLGAFDFLTKPCDQSRLDVVIAGAARSARAQRRIQDTVAAHAQQFSEGSFIGSSSAASQVRGMLKQLANVPFSALLITGETGTGKGLAAKILHHGSTRNDGPLVEINCAALPRDLLESELFGHEAGAFTGAKALRHGLLEQAHGGSLFLDEVGEMNVELQAKLLSAIEERKFRRLGGNREIHVDIQIIAATNQDLERRIRAGNFRADLFHRLAVFQLELPALRTRKEDLADLVPKFIEEYNIKAGKRVSEVSEEAWERLRKHEWPGNVRELRNIVERCVLFSNDEDFPAEWLQLGPSTAEAEQDHKMSLCEGLAIGLPLDGTMRLDDMDRYIIATALARNERNVTATARALGTTRETIRYRISKYGL